MSRPKKRGPGRPAFANPDDVRNIIFAIRVSAAEQDRIRQTALRVGAQSASDWARDLLLAAADKGERS